MYDIWRRGGDCTVAITLSAGSKKLLFYLAMYFTKPLGSAGISAASISVMAEIHQLAQQLWDGMGGRLSPLRS